MNEEKRRILEMLSSGKIDVDAAERLLAALGASGETAAEPPAPTAKSSPKYLRVRVEPSPDNPKGDKVNVRVPLNLIRAGMKWMALIPHDAQSKVQEAFEEKGMSMDLGKLKPEDLEELIQHLNELEVEVEGKDRVRVYCE